VAHAGLKGKCMYVWINSSHCCTIGTSRGPTWGSAAPHSQWRNRRFEPGGETFL